MRQGETIPLLGATGIRRAMEEKVAFVDLREVPCFGGAYIPGSINIGFSPYSADWLRDVIDPSFSLILVASREREVRETVSMFRAVGFDRILGYCVGVMDGILSGGDTGFLPQISVHALHHVLEKYEDHLLLDVRTTGEVERGVIPAAAHLPIHTLLERGGEFSISPTAHISVICRSGYRSNIAASFLKSRGYTHVYSVIGGMVAWEKAFGLERA